MESNNAPAPIDLIGLLQQFTRSLRRLWFLVLALCVLLAGLNYLRLRRSHVPMYESRATFSVSSGYGGDDVFSSSYYYDNTAAKELAAAFPHLLSTDMMRDLMLEQLDAPYINGTVSAGAVADTNMFVLVVRSNSAQDAYDILCAVIDCYPKVAMMMVENPSVAVRQEPTLPTQPYNHFSGSSAAIKGAVCGLILGLAAVCVAALLNKTFLTPGDLKKAVNLPLLAVVPHVNAKKRRAARQPAFLRAEDDRGLAEALRGLRAKLHKQLDAQGGKTILVTSTIPSEGKSTIAINLALSLASEGHRVVLLDADLRNQSIRRLLGGAQNQKGLMDCLASPRLSALSCLRTVSGTDLQYLSGTSTQKRHYSIDAKSMRRVLEELYPRFDYIVIDSPPCALISDTALLGRYADCVLYVVKQDTAAQNQVLEAVTGLYERDLPLAGCILNDVPRSRFRSGYGYGYGYGYGNSKKYGK